MNIEQIAVGIKDLHGLDMSDEAAITLLRHALSKLAEHEVDQPAAYTCNYEFYRLKPCSSINGQPVIPLYTETQLLAAQQRTAEACAKSAVEWGNARKDQYGGNALRNYAEAIRNGDWREYL